MIHLHILGWKFFEKNKKCGLEKSSKYVSFFGKNSVFSKNWVFLGNKDHHTLKITKIIKLQVFLFKMRTHSLISEQNS
jgi:hypothetical protein